MTHYGDPGHEQWLIEQEAEDERWGGHWAHQEILAEIGRRETEGLDWVDEPEAAEEEAKVVPVAPVPYQYTKDGYKDTLVEIPCPRCGGRGEIPSFRHVENGICFRCRGECVIHVRPTSREARQHAGTLARDNRPAPQRPSR